MINKIRNWWKKFLLDLRLFLNMDIRVFDDPATIIGGPLNPRTKRMVREAYKRTGIPLPDGPGSLQDNLKAISTNKVALIGWEEFYRSLQSLQNPRLVAISPQLPGQHPEVSLEDAQAHFDWLTDCLQLIIQPSGLDGEYLENGAWVIQPRPDNYPGLELFFYEEGRRFQLFLIIAADNTLEELLAKMPGAFRPDPNNPDAWPGWVEVQISHAFDIGWAVFILDRTASQAYLTKS